MEILFEDEYIIVVHKPHNIPTQTAKLTQKDLVSELRKHLSKDMGKDPYIGIVHRLDQNVEGLLVFAKDKTSAAELSKQMADNLFNKEYVAKVSGTVPENKQDLIDYLYSNPKGNFTEIVNKEHKEAKRSELSVEKTDIPGLVKIILKTGRKHQIRVQLSNAGLPIVGDLKYGNGERSLSGRLCLMAYSLSFNHPKSKKRLIFELPLTLTKEW